MGNFDVEARVAELYGAVDWSRAGGLLHVAAIHGPSNRIIAIGSEAPPSATDRFVLGFARARADVLVTTGGILRAEPELIHRYADSEADEIALTEWRKRVLGRTTRPRLLVLSATGRFPTDHPALAFAQGWLWTTEAGAKAVGDPPEGFEVGIAREEAGTIAEALAWVRSTIEGETSSATLLLEAGPSTTASLYEEAESPVDELLLSRFEGELAPKAEGPPFVDEDVLRSRLGPPCSSRTVEEASGPWTFDRSRRAD